MRYLSGKRKGIGKKHRGPGQPRIDAVAPLAHRSVGLPPAWWREIDRMAKRRGIKSAALVRAAVGVYLKRMSKLEAKLDRADAGRRQGPLKEGIDI